MNRVLCILLAAVALAACRKSATNPPEAPSPPEDEKGARHEDVVTLTPEALRTANIQLADVRRKTLGSGVNATARIEPTQMGLAKVSPRVQGRIADIRVQLGQRVKKGDILGMVESQELGRIRADYLAAAIKARVAEHNYEREKQLQAKGISSEREMREAEGASAANRADLDAADAKLHALGLSEDEIRALKSSEHFTARFPARAPIDGAVIDVRGAIGESVESTTPIFTVANLSELWVILDVFEAQLPFVKVGQKVVLRVDAVPNRTFEARVGYVGDVVDEKSRTVHVRVVIANREGLLKPGMFATAEIASTLPAERDAGAEASLVVPRSAVQEMGGKQVVFVPAGERKFKLKEVRVGRLTTGEAEVLSGIEDGSKVVTSGAFVLKSELSKAGMEEE